MQFTRFAQRRDFSVLFKQLFETCVYIPDYGDTKALYARLMSFMLGGLRAPLPAIPAKVTKRPCMRKAA